VPENPLEPSEIKRKPTPRPEFKEPTHIKRENMVLHTWGDSTSGLVTDRVISSTKGKEADYCFIEKPGITALARGKKLLVSLSTSPLPQQWERPLNSQRNSHPCWKIDIIMGIL